MSFAYPLVGLVTLLSLVVYLWMGINVGRGRGQYEVKAPATDGPEEFVRMVRVQANTTEGLIMFLPALWLFALSYGDLWGGIIGIIYPISRVIYAMGYYAAAEKRSLGFMIGFLTTAALIVGALIGLIRMVL